MAHTPYIRDGVPANAKGLAYWIWLAVTVGVMVGVAGFVFLP